MYEHSSSNFKKKTYIDIALQGNYEKIAQNL